MKILAFLFLLSGLAFAAEPVFRAGAAVSDISPPSRVVANERLVSGKFSICGSFQKRMARSVHDSLHARALVLDDGAQRIALVVVDNCLISRETFDEAKEIATKATGILPSRIMACATHTHSAPNAMELGQAGPDAQYLRILTWGIAEAIINANNVLKPAEIGFGTANVPEEVFNRRWFVSREIRVANPFGEMTDEVRTNPPGGNKALIKPADVTDPTLSLIYVRRKTGEPLALFANYALHYVGGVPAEEISSDYFGEFAFQVTGRLEGDKTFVGMMSNGASGDINNSDFINPRPRAEPYERIKIVAKRLADVTKEVCAKMEFHSHVPITMREAAMDVMVRHPNEDQLLWAREKLSNAKAPDALTKDEVYAHETIELMNFPGTVNLKLQTIQFGDKCAIGTMPCEAFVRIGLNLREKGPVPMTFLVGLANGYNGYLPTPEHHQLGGYETWRCRWSYLETQASVKMTDTLLKLFSSNPTP